VELPAGPDIDEGGRPAARSPYDGQHEQRRPPVPSPSRPRRRGVAGQTLSGADLYDLLVPDPTEQFLAELAERERSARQPGGEHPVVETDPGPASGLSSAVSTSRGNPAFGTDLTTTRPQRSTRLSTCVVRATRGD
jgi:hypothetical protein